MKIRAFVFVVIAALAASPAAAQRSVAGKWYAALGGVPVQFDFSVDADGRLTGAMSSDFTGRTPIADGAVKGDELSFTVRMAIGARTINYKGIVNGDELALAGKDASPPPAGGADQTFTATRTKPVDVPEISMVPVVVDDQTVRLEMRIYKPDRAGPLPTVIFHHGSTGDGRNPRLFTQPILFPTLAKFFVQRGWAFVVPARRGRAGSEGLYDEGFGPDRALGYSCRPAQSLSGADRALRDIAAATDAILAMPFVDRDRVVIGGQSRGGILAVAYAGQHPERLKGVINFVGGWMGTTCSNASTINQTLFRRGARYPRDTLWLYGEGDQFYPLSHSEQNFAAFQAAGGKGTFHEFPLPGSSGHYVFMNPEIWKPVVESYLKSLGLPAGE